jgi:hypothetical protein
LADGEHVRSDAADACRGGASRWTYGEGAFAPLAGGVISSSLSLS